MSIVTRLEAPFTNVPGANLFRVRHPHTAGTWATVTLPLALYPHKQALIEALNARFVALSVPVTATENYATGVITFTVNHVTAADFSWQLAESYGNSEVRAFLGIAADLYSAVFSVAGAPPTTLYLDAAPIDEAYYLRLNRTANFADDGRVGAALLGRYVAYGCELQIDNDEHAAFRAFWPWVASCRKLCLWRRFNTAWSAAAAYVSRPLLGDSGFKLISLDDASSDDLDAPRDAPNVTGHTHPAEGVVYGI